MVSAQQFEKWATRTAGAPDTPRQLGAPPGGEPESARTGRQTATQVDIVTNRRPRKDDLVRHHSAPSDTGRWRLLTSGLARRVVAKHTTTRPPLPSSFCRRLGLM